MEAGENSTLCMCILSGGRGKQHPVHVHAPTRSQNQLKAVENGEAPAKKVTYLSTNQHSIRMATKKSTRRGAGGVVQG